MISSLLRNYFTSSGWSAFFSIFFFLNLYFIYIKNKKDTIPKKLSCISRQTIFLILYKLIWTLSRDYLPIVMNHFTLVPTTLLTAQCGLHVLFVYISLLYYILYIN